MGISAERLLEIRKKLAWNEQEANDKDVPLQGHVGLYNVNQRLKLNYGNKAMLRITYDKRVGTVAEIRLPLEQPREEESSV